MRPRTKSNIVYYVTSPMVAAALILNKVAFKVSNVLWLTLGMILWCVLTMIWERQLDRAARPTT